ncbi:MAG: hypothetical protein IPO06_06295 [Leptospiraceae bacterium]|nr:hypothetical protein [Leptospiraceae bacterium]MBK9498992.1 hypothetical protein [Leptospiraceae bacterium]MBP9887616.1 hypothetical protein [Leptospiraceae bacterium]
MNKKKDLFRYNFPKEGVDGFDGYTYTKIFGGDSLDEAYDKLKEFLENNGYADIPVPNDTDELYLLFGSDEEESYKHNPISISFSPYNKTEIWLTLHNEEFPNHLLMFHEQYDPDKMNDLKNVRATRAIEFIEEKSKGKTINVKCISISELYAIKDSLLKLNLDKTTIVASLLQDAFSSNLVTEDEIKKEFGKDVLLKVIQYSKSIF